MVPPDAHYELATFLIEQGCDVLLAHHGYLRMGAVLERDGGMMWPSPPEPLLHVVERQDLRWSREADAGGPRALLAFFRATARGRRRGLGLGVGLGLRVGLRVD